MKLLSAIFFIFVSLSLRADNSVPDDVIKFGAQLLSHESKSYLVLNYEAAPKWHTYWKNPGDAGLPTSTEFSLDGNKIELSALEWPSPNRYFEQGNMLAFGYEKKYSFFFEPTGEQLKKIESGDLVITSKWLVCKHICIPGKKVLKLVKGSSTGNQLISRVEAVTRFKNLPEEVAVPDNLDLVLSKDEEAGGLVLFANLTSSESTRLNPSLNLLTPFPLEPFTFKHEEKFRDKKGNVYSKIPIEWDGEYSEPPLKLPINGVFAAPYKFSFLYANPESGKIQKVTKEFASFNLRGAQRLNDFIKILTPVAHFEPELKKEPSTSDTIEANYNPAASGKKPMRSIWTYILFAFIGGLILNIMPCVLPVISIKLFGLISHSEESKGRILKHNLVYTLGVLATFLLMASIVVLVKINGESIGWGFQLQSPKFIAITSIVLFIMSLNMFGLFEFSTPGGSKLGSVKLNDGFSGDFFSGVLATILSTPCSAPFLGTALTFAFTGSTFDVFATFLSIGLGLSAPFILTGFFPSLISWLPKPGLWMDTVKKFLGLTLLLTMVWLLDVFSTQVDGTSALIKLNTIIVLTFFAIYGHQKIAKKLPGRIVLYLLPIIFLVSLFSTSMESPAGSTGLSKMVVEKRATGLPWEVWSEEAMMNHVQDGNYVFMDFTAKWCFTCKVNEKTVIETKSFKELIERKGVKLLLADWTKRDPVIGNWLKSKGYVGVPAYFIQKPDGTLIDLGETISLKEIESKLD